MKVNLENTTVKDISYLVSVNCLRASCTLSLEKLAEMVCSSERYKIYLEDESGKLCGVIQVRQIALEILKLSISKDHVCDMLPAISYVLNFKQAMELAETPVTVASGSLLSEVLRQMDQNHIREIAVVDDSGQLIGTLEAKSILSHYLREKVEAALAQ